MNPGRLQRHGQRPPEEREPRRRVAPDSCKGREHDRVCGIADGFIVVDVVHGDDRAGRWSGCRVAPPDTGSCAPSTRDQGRQRQTLAGRRRAAHVAVAPVRFPSWPSLGSGKVAIQAKWIESKSNDGVARNRSDHYDRNGGGNQQIGPRQTLTMSEEKEDCTEHEEKRRERNRANCEQEEEYKRTKVDGRVTKGRMAAR